MDLESQVRLATALVTVANCVVLVRMLAVGQHRRFPMLVSWLAFELLQSAAQLFFSPTSNVYYWIFLISEPFGYIFYVLLVLEMYKLVFADYPGIASVARWAAYASGTAAVIVGIIEALQSKEAFPGLARYFLSWERAESFALSVFIVLMVAILSRYPIRLSRNLAAYVIIFAVYFLANFIALAFANQGGYGAPGVMFFVLGIDAATYIAWTLAMRREANSPGLRVRKTLSREDEERLIGELEDLNKVLQKSAGK